MNLTTLLPPNPLKTLIEEGLLVLRMPKGIQDSVKATFDAGYSFFREPVNSKNAFIFEQDLGYRPFGGEYSVSPDFPDQLESFSVSPRLTVSDERLSLASALTLQKQMSETFDLIETIVEALTMKLSNQVSEGRIGNHLRGKLRAWSRLQLNYAKPADLALPFINETHEDLDLLTLTCSPQPGLEIRLVDDFVPMDTTSEQLIVFPGEIAWLLSGGKLKPVYHRVRTHPRIRERISLLFFADPEPSSCEAWITTNTNRGVDIAARVHTNVGRFGLKGFKDDIGS